MKNIEKKHVVNERNAAIVIGNRAIVFGSNVTTTLRSACTICVLTLATAVLSLSAISETSLLRGRRSEWSGPAFTALRARSYDLFNKKDYAGAQTLLQQGYQQAQAHHDTLSSLRFLNNIGGVHFGLLHYRQAIDAFAQARKLAAATGDRDTLSVTCSNLCSLYMQIGDIAAATAAAQQGLNVPADTGLPYRSTMLVTLGLLASRSHDTPKALHYFRQAVEEAERYGPDPYRFEAWNHYSQELLRAGYLDAAETASLNALHIGNLNTVREVRPAYLTLARLHRCRGDTRTALALIERALAIPPRVGDRQLWKMYFLYERARVHLSEGNAPAALPDLRLALSFAHDWREAIVPSDGLRSSVEFFLKDLYDSYIDAASTTNDAAEAFLAAEEERSASLVQMLTAGSGAEPQPGRSRLPQSYWEDLARLRALEIVRVANRSAYNAKAAAQIRQRLSEAEIRAGAEFIPTPSEKGENILSLSTLHGVQHNIGPTEAVLSLHLGASASVVWALTSDRLEMHHLASGDRLEGLAERFHRAVEESAPGRDQLGAQLYKELFGSLSAPVLEKSSWIITADDALI